MRREFISKCDEAKCLIGVPVDGSIDQSVIDGVHAYYDNVILPTIENRELLHNEANIRYNIGKRNELAK